MEKYRWAQATFEVTLGALSERLRQHYFDSLEEDAEGFRIENLSTKSLAGHFIERETFLEHFSLPTGDAYDEKRTRVSVVKFSITDSREFNLLLINPPKKLIPFFNALSTATDFGFFVEAAEADVLRWAECLEPIIGKLKVTYLDCSQITVSEGVTGRFAFRGDDDVRQEVAKVLKRGAALVESAKCEFSGKNGRVVLELFRSGSVRSGPLDAAVLEAIRSSLAQCCAVRN